MRYGRWYRYGAIGVWAVVLCAGGCGSDSGADAPPAVAQAAATRQEMVPVVCRQEYPEVRGIGVVRARAEVGISPEIAGTVLQVHCEVGSRVANGDVLVELSSEAHRIAVARRRAEVRKAEARYRKSTRDMGKADSLFSGGVMSDSEHDDAGLDRDIAAAELALARSNLAAAEKDLRDTRLQAPFDGSIALKDVEVGDYVAPGTVVLTLVSIDAVKVVINVSEMDIPQVQPGDSVSIAIDSLGSELFAGSVHTIALKADETTRSFAVETIVDNPGHRILPGMVARVTIRSTEPVTRCMVPARAIRTVGETSYVRLAQDNGTLQREVRLGPPRGDQMIILEGLRSGERVLLDPPVDL